MASDTDILKDEREEFEKAADAEEENRANALDDLKFARLGEQWPEAIRKQREIDGRPVLTINKLPAFIRQVVNDSRQNRPQIKVKPVDDKADVETAQIMEGLIRNIERTSKADVAYDTAVDYAVSCGFGYIRVAIDYEYDDTFDKCLKIERIANPFSVYGDPNATSMDGSDWNRAWVTEYLPKEQFRAKWKGAQEVDWEDSGYDALKLPWRDGDDVLTCESWTREETQRKILLLNNGQVVGEKEYEAGKDVFVMAGILPVNSRMARAYKITQRIMTGAEILEENEWLGQYLPIIPVYGEELNVEGKRYFRSLIHNAVDAQRMFNYWRTTATELVALAPRVPFIGEEGTFDADPNWLTANSQSHAYLQYKKGSQPPQRQPLDGGAAGGAIAEALAASDDMKAIIGMYDASLGQKSNETSGRAIMARQREGDVSTFHFIDNLARSIRHVGCVLLDLIPKVYSGQRVIRIIGKDDTESVAKIAPKQGQEGEMQVPPKSPVEDIEPIYDLSMGRYDVAVDTGPGYTTQREQSRAEMVEVLRSVPQLGEVAGDLIIKGFDWPQAEEIADRLKAMLPAGMQGEDGVPPEVAQMVQEGQDKIKELEDKLEEANVDGYKAETDRLNTLLPYMTPESLAALGLQVSQQAMATPDVAPGAAPSPVSPVAINMPEQVGGALAENLAATVAPIIAQTVAQAMAQTIQSMPPLRTQPMKRTPVRDPATGLILHTVDEPIDEAAPPQNPMVN